MRPPRDQRATSRRDRANRRRMSSALQAIVLVGTRPNFVKASALVRAARMRPEIDLLLVHTGQHYDDAMSGRFLRDLEVPDPVAHLGVGSASHAVQTACVMSALDELLDGLSVEELVVVGDVNSTLAGAL